MLHLKVDLTFHFEKHKKLRKNGKDPFDIGVDVSLDNVIKGTPLNLRFGSFCILYILYSAEQTELLTFSN